MTDLGLHHIGRHLIGLKRLNLLSSWRITDAGILSLVHSLTELEYLNLSSCKEVTNSGLTEITDKCKKLKLLDVTGCTAITERNVSNAMLLLQMYLCVIFSGCRKSYMYALNFFPSRIISEYCSGAKF